MSYTLVFSREFSKEVANLDKPVRERIQKAVDRLRETPTLGKPLTGILAGRWSLRAGDYRILYRIHHHELIVLLLTVGHRREVYK